MGRMIRPVFGAAFLLAASLLAQAAPPPAPPGKTANAELDARRLQGRAYYENEQYAEAVTEYRRCIELAPDAAVDYFNLGLVQMRARQYDEALASLENALERDPDLLAVHYVRGIIYKRQGRFEEAVRSLDRVVERDPGCRGALYNLGVCHKALKRYDEAIAAFSRSAELAPDDPSTQYQLISLYRRIGRVEDAERHTEIFLRVKDTVDESEKTEEALERSTYSDILDAPRLTGDLPARDDTEVRFIDVTGRSGLGRPAPNPAPADGDAGAPAHAANAAQRFAERHVPAVGGGVAVADYDGDGDLDVYAVHCDADPGRSANRLYRNGGSGRFEEVGAAAGVSDPGLGLDAAFGDYDNDGHLDLYVANWGRNVLYRNRGDGTFEDVSAAARVDEPQFARRAIFVDYDHDNDLDIFVANDVDFSLVEDGAKTDLRFPEDFGGQANTLLRNQGNGTFSDQTDAAGLLTHFAQTRDALVTDLDGDTDLDLLVVNADAPAQYFANERLGRFHPGGAFSPAIPPRASAVAEGDFNRDGRPDLIVAAGRTLHIYRNNGGGAFSGRPLPLPATMARTGAGRIDVLDYNNDGWSDLLFVGADGASLGLLAGAGMSEFHDVSGPAGLDGRFSGIAGVATGDLDRDGDEDIVLQTRDHGTVMLRNEGMKRRHWIHVRLVGEKVNRSGYGAVVEVASGGHYQKRSYVRDGLHFGLGDLEAVDVVRVTWPNGVAQNVIRPAIDANLTIEEKVKVSASCGFLYAFNGRTFELVNEILGIGPLGVPIAPGAYHQPDSTELTGIASHQLAATRGFYELRLTEELRETMYADQFALRVVDHPERLEIIPNEMFSAPPFPEDRLYAVAAPRPPLSAVDDRGSDVLELVRDHDGRVPTFPLTRYEGLARPHSLTLDLGDLSGARRVMLYLDGWIYWAESSTVMAIAQDPRFALTPLSLEVRDAGGRWRTAIASVGLPTSKGLIVPVDLTGLFPSDDFHVRLSTTMSVYFDRIFVSTEDHADEARVTELPVARADLRYRGFSAMRRDALGYERFDYHDARPTGSWSPPAGLFTRYGDVTPLLARPDDMYVIFGPGDELALRFDARALPDLPAGWTRDFVFYADGWVKDGDLNTRFSDTVTPLPFHGMSGYPYPASEHYPDTADLRRYRRTWNTRPGRSTVGSLRPGASPPPPDREAAAPPAR